MNTFTLGACFQHELHTGPYFMTFAPRLNNTPARYYCSFGKLRTMANGAPDWCDLREVD